MCGFPAEYGYVDENNNFMGVVTKDKGIGKNNERKDNFEPGITIKAHQTILAEGCRGSISETVIDHFQLRNNAK